MSLLSVLELCLGIMLVAIVLTDIFLAVVVPRRAPNIGRLVRVSALVISNLWRVWRAVGMRLLSTQPREALLGSFASLAIVILLAVWVAGLILGYGLIFDALREQIRPVPENLGTSIYFGGVSMLTLGFGDFVATGGWARLVSLIAAATGLGLFALVITLLFTLYGSFQRRERAVVLLEAGAGAPPSGVTLLETYAHGGMLQDLPGMFQDWQAWAAEVLDSHLAYPILAYFRSSHDNDSWISSLGAVMDAATLVLTTIEDGPKGWAKLARGVGNHCLEDLVYAFRLPTDDDVGVEREEFDEAYRRLADASYRLRAADQAWEDFARLRREYAGRVNALARHWASPPAQWIGDRSPLKHPRIHEPRPQLTQASEGTRGVSS